MAGQIGPAAAPQPNAEVSISRSAGLSRALMFVSDKESADAVAPEVAALLKGADPRSIRVADYDLGMMQAMRCFGSVSLQKALEPVIPMLQLENYPQLEPYRQYYEAMWSYMDDMASMFDAVDSKQSADMAADMVAGFPPFMLSLLEKADALPVSDDASTRAGFCLGRPVTRVKVGRLLTAWGKLQQRDADYYGSERLRDSMDGLGEVLQNLDIEIDPDGVGVLASIAHGSVPLLREWIDVARSINSRESADAAAPKLLALRRRMSALAQGAPIGLEYETDIFNICPESELLIHVCDHIAHYFEDEISPPFFGSTALKAAMSHED